MKKALAAAMKSGAEGIKIVCGGRLAGAEIARSEKYHDGRVPLHTLRADIDYATYTAHTTYGTIGVKVWICRGEVLGRADGDKDSADKGGYGIKDQPADTRRRRARRKKQSGHKPKGGGRKAKPSARDLDRSKRPEKAPRTEKPKPKAKAASTRKSDDTPKEKKPVKKARLRLPLPGNPMIHQKRKNRLKKLPRRNQAEVMPDVNAKACKIQKTAARTP
jgi:hypothetical protein